MSLRRLLNFAYATMVDDLVSLGLSKVSARQAVDQELSRAYETPEEQAEREERESAGRNMQAIQGLIAAAGARP